VAGEAGRPAVSSSGWERELHVLDQALRRLSAEYDAFLYGSASKPPIETRKHVEEMVRRLNASESMSSAERYRFSTLQGRFATMTEKWERLQGEKEAGRRPGMYGHFQPVSPKTSSSGPNAGPSSSVTDERHPAAAVDPDRDLFDRYVAAKKAMGEDVSGYRLEGFLEGLERERRKVRERFGSADLVFEVAERDGRVRLIAKKRTRGES
jgi:hypothetical protein